MCDSYFSLHSNQEMETVFETDTDDIGCLKKTHTQNRNICTTNHSTNIKVTKYISMHGVSNVENHSMTHSSHNDNDIHTNIEFDSEFWIIN